MFDTNRIKQDFSRAAEHYDEYALLQQDVLRKLLERAKPLIPDNARILDAGCGTGQFTRELAVVQGTSETRTSDQAGAQAACRKGAEYPNARNINIIQLDISYNMCIKSAENGNPVINGTMESLPFADASFDVVFSSLALQWLPDWQSGIRELKRVLKPGGLLAVSAFGQNSLRELRNSFSASDDEQHISPFMQMQEGWKKETVTQYFTDLTTIMLSLKAIGANNKLATRSRGLMTPGKLKKIENFYHSHFSHDSGLPVTWEVLYLVQRL